MSTFRFRIVVTAILFLFYSTVAGAKGPVDPGVRKGTAGGGQPLAGLTTDELAYFKDGAARFVETESVTGGANNGLGPRFNGNQCAMCHVQPAIGGSSPTANPLPALATLNGAQNSVPWFIAPDGPIREARFKRNPDGSVDGGVHAIYVITGRSDAQGCNLAQPNFLPAGDPRTALGGNRNFSFRIATPLFGLGLIEAIPDSAILINRTESSPAKRGMGIAGHANANISAVANHSANDGTITRFGWKAQNKSLLIFAAEAYNVEMGITNMLFPQERALHGGLHLQRHAGRHHQFHTAGSGRNSGCSVLCSAVRYPSICEFHAHAGAARSSARHRLLGPRTRSFFEDWLRALSHADADDGQSDRQRRR